MKEVTRVYLRCVFIELGTLLYILLLIIKYVYKRYNVKTIKNYSKILRLFIDLVPMSILYS